MTVPITVFLMLGVLFGLATFSRRHLFSEGGDVAAPQDGSMQWGARIVWAATCSGLWPLFVLTGAYGAWRQRAKARAQPPR
jgi:hypothetical protein